MLELASSNDPADTPGDQPACDLPPRATIYAAPDDLTQVADWLQERTADGV